MMALKSFYIKDIKQYNDESEIETLLMVKKKYQDGESKNVYFLGDKTGDIKVTLSKKYNFHVGDVVKVIISSQGEVNLDSDNVIKEYMLEDFLPSVKRPIEDIMKELEAISLEEFKSSEVQALNDYFFSDKEFTEKFKKGIGGLSQHHGYIGGLAEHTLNVTYLAKVFADRYNCKNKEIAILAAKLHDIGKIYEYSVGGPFAVTMRGEMEGHIIIGISMVEEAFKKSPHIYSEEFIQRIKGCIVQHHGKVEYGSPKAPNTEEAFIVHYADYVDATMNKIWQVKEATEPGTWSEYDRRIGTRLLT
jgi:3'-5' exoribonuclease